MTAGLLVSHSTEENMYRETQHFILGFIPKQLPHFYLACVVLSNLRPLHFRCPIKSVDLGQVFIFRVRILAEAYRFKPTLQDENTEIVSRSAAGFLLTEICLHTQIPFIILLKCFSCQLVFSSLPF